MANLGPLMKAIAALVAIVAGFGSYQPGGSSSTGSGDISSVISQASAASAAPGMRAAPGGDEGGGDTGEISGTQPSPTVLPASPTAAPTVTPPVDAAPIAAAPVPAQPSPSMPSAPVEPGVGEAEIMQGSGQTVKVTNAQDLTAALSAAQAGQTIEMADGTYAGNFTLDKPGTGGNPITLKGSKNAIISGSSGYTILMNGANYWQLIGFSVTGGDKGVMIDKTHNSILSDLSVGKTGQEGVHFLNFSSNNILQHSLIHDTGLTKPQFGEGLYFGTAKSNWGKKSGGQPDKSNGNQAINNTFKATTAENIDVKEETSGGVIAGNHFDGSAISGENFADSVLDMKGYNYQVVDNVTTGSSPKLLDGFQTHVITDPATSGCNNTFKNNKFDGITFNGGQAIAEDPKCGGGSAPVNAGTTGEDKGGAGQ